MNLQKMILSLLPILYGSAMLIADLPEEERDEIGVRAWPESELIAFERWRTSEWEKLHQHEKETLAEATKTSPIEFTCAVSDIVSKAIVSSKAATDNLVSVTNHPGIFHNAIGFSGNKIGLEDGSWWTIYSKDISATRNWLTMANSYMPDSIVIIPNIEWPNFSSYRYYLTNQQTGVSIKANLSLAPIKYGVYTRYISSSIWLIDNAGYFYVQLCLNDGSFWNMLSIDFPLTSLWHVDDTVIIGGNGGYTAAYAPNILINIATDNYSAGTCIRN